MTRFDDWAAHLDPELHEPVVGSEAEALDRISEALTDQALWDGPPSSLRVQILAAAKAEVAGDFDPPSIVIDPAAEPDRAEGSATALSPARAKARTRWLPTAMAAVAAAAVAIVATISVPRLLEGGGAATYEVAGTELTPDASATVEVEPLGAGVAITLNITGLPPADDGRYYAGWLTSPDGEQVPIGSFHWREGGIPIELWSGVDVERYPILGVTLQEEGEPTTSNGVVVLRGRIAD